MEDNDQLVLTDRTQLEIVQDVGRLFALTGAKLSFHFDEGYIQIMVLPRYEGQFVLPTGPQDLRVSGSQIETMRQIHGI
jgi:hypothetical protein